MSTNPTQPNLRRLTLAISAAVAATTIAIGVTAASLFGWYRSATPPALPAEPTAPAPAEPPAPSPEPAVAPAAVPVEEPAAEIDDSAMQLATYDDDDDDDDHRGRRHHDDDDDDDEDDDD